MATNDDRNVGAFTLDTHLVVRAWGTWIADATGIPSQAAHGKPLQDLVPGLEARGLLPLFREVLAAGTVRVLSAPLHRYLIPCPPSGPSRQFAHMQQHVTIGPLREGDRIVGAMVTIEDVTARREREVEEAQRATAADGTAEAVSEVRAALREDNWQARRQATRALVHEGGREGLVQSLVAALREEHRNFAVVSSALQLLAQIHLDVVEPLVDLLDSPDADLRIQAALSLGDQGDPRAIPALLRALDDPDTNVRFHAVEALGKLGAIEAAPPLVAVASSGDFFLAFAALDALARIGDSLTAPRLIPLLQDPLLRAAAVDALGTLGDESTVAPLASLLDEAAAPVEAIAQAIVSLHACAARRFGDAAMIGDEVRKHVSPAGVQRVIDAVRDASGESLRSLAIVLGWLEGEGVEAALVRLLGRHDARREVVEGLVRFGRRVTDLLVDQLQAETLETRQAAVIALGRIGDRRATPALLALIERDRDLVLTGAGALAKIGDAAAFEHLLPFLSDPDAGVRQAVIAALNSIGHPDMVRRVLPLLDDPNPHTRESAVKIAGYFGYTAAVDLLFERTSDPDEQVRRAAVEQLPFLDDDRATATLMSHLREDAPRVRAAAAQALGRLDTPAVVAPLLAALGDPDSWVRYFAARSLGHLGAQDAVAQLARQAHDDPATHARLSAVEALGDIGGAAAAVALASLSGAGQEVGATALRALGRIDDNAAWPALREGLRSDDTHHQVEAIRAVARRGSGEATSLLEWVAAASGDAAVVREATEALARIASSTPEEPGAVAALIRLTADPPRREAAVAALGSLPVEKSGTLAAGLSDPRVDVRTAVVEALARMRGEMATGFLRKALDDRAAPVRRAAIAALRHLGSWGTDERLAALARSDPDPVVRGAAAAAVGDEDEGERGPADGQPGGENG